jgi:hypothetical protein
MLSLQSTVCIENSPEILACAAIYLAAQDVGIPLPENPHWCALFEVKQDKLLEVATVIKSMHQGTQTQT